MYSVKEHVKLESQGWGGFRRGCWSGTPEFTAQAQTALWQKHFDYGYVDNKILKRQLRLLSRCKVVRRGRNSSNIRCTQSSCTLSSMGSRPLSPSSPEVSPTNHPGHWLSPCFQIPPKTPTLLDWLLLCDPSWCPSLFMFSFSFYLLPVILFVWLLLFDQHILSFWPS